MIEVILGGLIVGVALVSFGAGGLVATDIAERNFKRQLQRSTRPAHIHIHQTPHIVSYTVQPGALDIDFPNSEGRV